MTSDEGLISDRLEHDLTLLCLKGYVECVGRAEEDGELMFSLTSKGESFMRATLREAGMSERDVKNIPMDLFLTIVGPKLK